MGRYKRLGDMIVEGSSPGTAGRSCGASTKEGGKLGEILTKLNYVTVEQIVNALVKVERHFLHLSYVR